MFHHRRAGVLRTMSVFLALLVVTVSGAASGTAPAGRYVAGSGALAIWCHEDHDIVQNVQDALDGPWGPLDPKWPLYAEPECWAADVLNDVEQAQGNERVAWGFGGFAWGVPPAALGTWVAATTNDLHSGADTFMTLSGGSESGADAVSEGCGPQAILLPLDLELHWQSQPDAPLHIYWAFIPVAGMDGDLHLCLASTGWVG